MDKIEGLDDDEVKEVLSEEEYAEILNILGLSDGKENDN